MVSNPDTATLDDAVAELIRGNPVQLSPAIIQFNAQPFLAERDLSHDGGRDLQPDCLDATLVGCGKRCSACLARSRIHKATGG
mmetsp:Transcript_81581/g.253557  ORF Transcript_81581/g.253557 Transcript_81581/m.253557 type:complete len:83 (+) Transcript_81581:463-711(+)